MCKNIRLVKERIADGSRALAFTIREPHLVITHLQLLKHLLERDASVPVASVDQVSVLLQESDRELNAYITEKNIELRQLIENSEVSPDISDEA
jgi:hypothetical protein